MNACITAVIVAAGSSSRIKTACPDKLWLEINGIPVLARTLINFQKASTIDKIIVVCKPCMFERVSKAAKDFRIDKFAGTVAGGPTRAHSVLNGVKACEDSEFVAIADGARPFTAPADIDRVSQAAKQNGGAILCVPVKDTVKQTENGQIVSTPSRETLLAAQTPQTFQRKPFTALLEQVIANGISVTDDSSVWEMSNKTVCPVIGSFDNLKITTAEDIAAAQAIARKGESPSMRIGHGYDVHKLVEGRPLILCGTSVPYEKGLLGHSDADVALHALMDAMLGALALGDIGQLFPDSDPAYKNANSLALLEQVYQKVKQAGYTLENADITILAQRPKLAGFIPQMRQTVAQALEVPSEQISVKATTEEGLGFTGNGDGIAAHSVCLLKQA